MIRRTATAHDRDGVGIAELVEEHPSRDPQTHPDSVSGRDACALHSTTGYTPADTTTPAKSCRQEMRRRKAASKDYSRAGSEQVGLRFSTTSAQE
ncbi:hypothetical protein GQ600_23706 [Phytophthora cactorum]|nr:hypothetical protein GQ600_23706 [Phytophthora cactorum]